jgi:hypothetical protein
VAWHEASISASNRNPCSSVIFAPSTMARCTMRSMACDR